MERLKDNSEHIHTSANILMNEGFINDPGLTKTSVCNSSITWLDGEVGELRYRGYAIDELASNYDFIDVMHLLIQGEIANTEQKQLFQKQLEENYSLANNINEIIRILPDNAHPMAIISMLLANACADKNINNSDVKQPDKRYAAAMHILSIMPKLAVIAAQKAQGLEIKFDKKFAVDSHSITEGILQKELAKDHIFVRAIDKILTLHADHELNASTFTMRVTASTNSNAYACILAAISALWGPAHGGANEACLKMLDEIGEPSNIPKYIAKAKDKNDPFKLMGFGHRVYKNYDPRAKIMQELCHEVLAVTGKNNDLLKVAQTLEETSLNDPYFIERKLYPNVDFYSGIILNAIGIPTSMFTVIFALARTTGWLSHWLEMHDRGGFKIFRPRQFYDGIKTRDLDVSTKALG